MEHSSKPSLSMMHILQCALRPVVLGLLAAVTLAGAASGAPELPSNADSSVHFPDRPVTAIEIAEALQSQAGVAAMLPAKLLTGGIRFSPSDQTVASVFSRLQQRVRGAWTQHGRLWTLHTNTEFRQWDDLTPAELLKLGRIRLIAWRRLLSGTQLRRLTDGAPLDYEHLLPRQQRPLEEILAIVTLADERLPNERPHTRLSISIQKAHSRSRFLTLWLRKSGAERTPLLLARWVE